MLTPFARGILITIIGTIGAIMMSVSIIYLADILLPDYAARFDNYAFAVGIPAGVAPTLIYPLIWLYYRMEEARQELARMVRTDVLTGVANRRGFFERAEEIFARAGDDESLFVLMIDIDHFKRVNDIHGHAAGDELLQCIARTIGDALRDGCRERTCLIARIGGEEFVALLAGVHATEASSLAGRICREAALTGVHADGEFVSTTVSIGIAARRSGQSLDEVMRAADKAAYDAKRAGRNRWAIHEIADLGGAERLSRDQLAEAPSQAA